MDAPHQEKTIIALGSWLDTEAGAYVRAWEQRCIEQLTADIFGFNALQIGLPQIDALKANRMTNKWLADVQAGPRVAVVHDLADMPFASQSLDLIVLAHVLEFSSEPHQVLREVERVLIPEGRLIICGFNPASLWGVRHISGRLSGAPFLPLDGELISVPRLKDWLKLLNLEVSEGHFGCYAPPCRTDAWLRRFAMIERAGERWWPYLGAVYMVQAIKRVKAMRLIGPVRQLPRGAVHGIPATHKIRPAEPPEKTIQ